MGKTSAQRQAAKRIANKGHITVVDTDIIAADALARYEALQFAGCQYPGYSSRGLGWLKCDDSDLAKGWEVNPDAPKGQTKDRNIDNSGFLASNRRDEAIKTLVRHDRALGMKTGMAKPDRVTYGAAVGENTIQYRPATDKR